MTEGIGTGSLGSILKLSSPGCRDVCTGPVTVFRPSLRVMLAGAPRKGRLQTAGF
jgi:hypothetical protein